MALENGTELPKFQPTTTPTLTTPDTLPDIATQLAAEAKVYEENSDRLAKLRAELTSLEQAVERSKQRIVDLRDSLDEAVSNVMNRVNSVR